MRSFVVAAAAAAGAAVAITALYRWRRGRRSSTRSPPRPAKALFLGPAADFVEPVRALLTTAWTIDSVGTDRADQSELTATAMALVGGLAQANALLRLAGPDLKLMQCHFTGTDWLERSAVPAGCFVCNATGQEVAIAEWVIGAMLRRLDRITELDAAMRTRCAAAAADGSDLGFAPPFFASPPPSPRTELSACTVGIVGYGLIGSHIAARVAAFGCRVVATVGRAAPPPCPTGLAWLGGGGALRSLLEESDFVVLACPLNEHTKGLVGAAELGAMKRTACLINIARGPVVDEAALYEALADGTIGGAAIDVWYRLPAIAAGQRECAPYDLKVRDCQ